jgi:adenylate cyclase
VQESPETESAQAQSAKARETGAIPIVPALSFAKMAQVDSKIDPEILGGDIKYTVEEVAERSGTSVEFVLDIARWLGRVPRGIDEVRYADSDVNMVRYTADFAARQGLSRNELASMIRSIAGRLENMAMQQVESIIESIWNQNDISDTESRIIAAEMAPHQAAEILPIVEHIWRRKYLAATHRLTTGAITLRGLHSDDLDYPLVRAVGFADLVDFTARTESATTRQFAELIREFHDKAWDIINSRGGRIINFIGDAVFFVADNLEAGAEVALGLAASGMTDSCGPVRVGMVWTRVLATQGDIFGPGVNLASRITSIAEPNEVFIGPTASARLSRIPRYSVVPQPPIDARGIGRVMPARLRYADDPRNSEKHDKEQVSTPVWNGYGD